jgi:hypothetical protein
MTTTTNETMTATQEPEIPREARIAEHSSAIRSMPDWTRIAQHTAKARRDRTEACPPRSLEERLWPFLLALRIVADSFDRAGMLRVWAHFAHDLLTARLRLLDADLALIVRKISDEMMRLPASQQQQTRSEYARARRLRIVLADAIDQLEALHPDTATRANIAQALNDGELCPTCLRAPVPGCASGWLEGPLRPGARHPLSVECEQRAQINGHEPRVWDRDSRAFVTLTAEESER